MKNMRVVRYGRFLSTGEGCASEVPISKPEPMSPGEIAFPNSDPPISFRLRQMIINQSSVADSARARTH